MDNCKSISYDKIENYSEFYENNPISKVATKALSKNSIQEVCYDLPAGSKMNYKFSLEISTMPVTNQKSSGRCWLFAALNVLREKLGKNINVENIELSQNYIAFYDKFEKANFFLEKIIETANSPIEDRLVNWLLRSPVNDGGQWDMFVGLVKKYGLVPKDAMPETFQSSNTSGVNRILNTKLREYACTIRNDINNGVSLKSVREKKDVMLKEIYNVLCICFNKPVKEFDFEYVDKDKLYHVDKGLTPKTFYDKYIGVNLDDYVSVVHAPTESKPFNRTYTVDCLGSVIEAEPILYLNLELSELKKLVAAQLKDNEIVWFGCDTGKYGSREEGIWDTNLYDYSTPFGLEFNMTKGEMLDYNQSSMGHAMVITGVNFVDDNTIDKWKIQNSWGDDKGNKGYFIISDDWFDRYVYQVCINKKYLSQEQLEMLKMVRIVLKPWDPMGSLA